ncbi:MAG: hypothetical protein ACLTIG_05840 [Roseburia hominis]
MKSKLIKQKRWWLRGILMVLFAVGMFFITMNVQTEAGTLQYRAEISSSTRENNITFVCNLNQTIDGQQVGYQWQENKGSGWQNIFGATGGFLSSKQSWKSRLSISVYAHDYSQ